MLFRIFVGHHICQKDVTKRPLLSIICTENQDKLILALKFFIKTNVKAYVSLAHGQQGSCFKIGSKLRV